MIVVTVRHIEMLRVLFAMITGSTEHIIHLLSREDLGGGQTMIIREDTLTKQLASVMSIEKSMFLVQRTIQDM